MRRSPTGRRATRRGTCTGTLGPAATGSRSVRARRPRAGPATRVAGSGAATSLRCGPGASAPGTGSMGIGAAVTRGRGPATRSALAVAWAFRGRPGRRSAGARLACPLRSRRRRPGGIRTRALAPGRPRIAWLAGPRTLAPSSAGRPVRRLRGTPSGRRGTPPRCTARPARRSPHEHLVGSLDLQESRHRAARGVRMEALRQQAIGALDLGVRCSLRDAKDAMRVADDRHRVGGCPS